MSTYTAKFGGREITFLKMTKGQCNDTLRAIRAAQNVQSSWIELSGVIGGEEHQSHLSCFGGNGEGVIKDPAKYSADLAALLSEIPATITKETAAKLIVWANQIYKEHLPIVDNRETPQARSERLEAQNAEYKRQNEERDAFKRVFAAKYADSAEPMPTPEGMQAVTIELTYNDSDSQSDYFDWHHGYGFEMVLGYLPKGSKRTEANARKFLALYPELSTLEWKWHTENYSMGHGNWLDSFSGDCAEEVTTYGGHTGPALMWEVSMDGGYHKTLLPFRGYAQAHNPQAPRAQDPKPQTVPSVTGGPEVVYDRDWTWLKFPGKPDESTLALLHSLGGRFSFKRMAWYFTKHLEESDLSLFGSAQAPADVPALPGPATPAPVSSALPAQLREKADKMQQEIDNKLNPAIGEQNFTERRARIAASMRQDGYHLEKIQAALRALASAHEAGTIPAALVNVTTKKAIEGLLYEKNAALLALIEGKAPDRQAEENRRELENKARALVGQIPGYFPTPKEIVDQMLDLANVQEGDSVLEPEAGAGAIAEEARARGAEVDTIECNYTLRDVLKVKGFDPIGHDFLEMSPNGKRYNKIVMNPPFESMQDVDHVRHAYGFLADGGCLVSVMSESPFHRTDRKAQDFREWLSCVGYDIDLPAGAFQESGTGVKTRLVVIEKPEAPKQPEKVLPSRFALGDD